MLNPEYVTVIAGGVVYEGWPKMSVTAGIEQAVREFTLETTERVGEWNFRVGTPIEIRANGDLLVRGYVNAYQGSGDATTHRITIRGRGKGQDFVDCSAEHPTHEFENQDPLKAARALDHYGIGITADVPLDAVPRMHVTPGESPWNFVERYLRPMGVTMMGEPDGSIRLTNASAARGVYGILMEGQNIKSWQVDHNDGSRHSKYIARGQGRTGTGGSRLRVSRSATDSGVRRRRTRVLANETDTDPDRAKKRAEHERDRAAGKSVRGSVQTQGFRDMAGKLFTPNTLIYVHSPILMHLCREMLIESVKFSQDQSGSLTDLQLVDPRAYKGKGAGQGRGQASGRGGGSEDVNVDGVPDGSATDPAWTDGF